MPTRAARLVLTLVTLTIAPIGFGGESDPANWPRFRGHNGDGLAPAGDIPVAFTEKDYLWKTAIAGKGHGSPVVWGSRVFLTTGDAGNGKRTVQCIGASDGKLLWSKDLPGTPYKMHKSNSVASGTPAVDAERVYTAWGTPQQVVIAAFEHDGNAAWQADLGPFKGGHGFGTSPVLVGDLVILSLDADNGGSIVAVERTTGKLRWQLERTLSKNATYSTPCLYAPAGREPELIFTNWQHGITAVDPKSGKVNWELSVFEVDKQERAIASPVIAGDLILGTCGFVTAQKHLVAIRPDDPAKGEKPREVWRIEKSVSYLPTPIVKGGRVYLCSEQGIATCLEAATGKEIWQDRVGGDFYASPVCIGDRIYCASRNGEVVVIAAADEFKVLGRSQLGAPTQSTPAVAGGRMFLRVEGWLVCIGKP